jgi:hypothetical protein
LKINHLRKIQKEAVDDENLTSERQKPSAGTEGFCKSGLAGTLPATLTGWKPERIRHPRV